MSGKYGDRVLLIEGDVTSKQDLEGAFVKTVSKWNKLSIVVNNAGNNNLIPPNFIRKFILILKKYTIPPQFRYQFEF